MTFFVVLLQSDALASEKTLASGQLNTSCSVILEDSAQLDLFAENQAAPLEVIKQVEFRLNGEVEVVSYVDPENSQFKAVFSLDRSEGTKKLRLDIWLASSERTSLWLTPKGSLELFLEHLGGAKALKAQVQQIELVLNEPYVTSSGIQLIPAISTKLEEDKNSQQNQWIVQFLKKHGFRHRQRIQSVLKDDGPTILIYSRR